MAIPKLIEELAHKVRTEIYGRDVREALATSMEATAEVAEWSRQVAQQIIDGEFDEAALATEIESKLNQLEQDYAPKLTNLENEIEDARGNESNLGDRLDDVSSQLAQKATVETTSSIGKFNWWYPPKQPSFNNEEPDFDSDSEVALNINTTGYGLIMSRLWDKFIDDPNLIGYVTKTVFGKDQSDRYDIYRYEFTPESYEKTIIIGAGIHGWERVGVGVLSRFMHHVCYDYKKYPQLEYIRKKVRVIIMPFENPYGYIHGGSRQNSRGVDLNRNFPYYWNNFTPTQNYPGGYDYKGDAPASEKETQYIISTLDLYNDAVAYLDFHNMSGGSPTFHFYTPMYEANEKSIPNKIYPKFDNLDCRQGRTIEPNAFNYAAKIDMQSANPEFVVSGVNSTYPYGSEEMTKWVEFAGNVILKYLELEKPSFQQDEEPFNYYLDRTWLAGAGATVSSTYEEVDMPTFEFDVPCDGIVTLEMKVSYINSNGSARNFFTPLFGQIGTNILPSERLVTFEVYKDAVKTDGRDSASLSASIPVRKTESGQLVKVGLWARTTEGQIEIARIRSNISFIPSNGKKRQRVLFYNSQNQWADVGFKYDNV